MPTLEQMEKPLDVNSKDFGWCLAKIEKHGYANFPYIQNGVNAVKLLEKNGIMLKPGKEYGVVEDEYGKEYLIQPYKKNIKKITLFLENKYGIESY